MRVLVQADMDGAAQIVPPARVRYLSDIADTVHRYHADTAAQAEAARRLQALNRVRDELSAAGVRVQAVETHAFARDMLRRVGADAQGRVTARSRDFEQRAAQLVVHLFVVRVLRLVAERLQHRSEADLGHESRVAEGG